MPLSSNGLLTLGVSERSFPQYVNWCYDYSSSMLLQNWTAQKIQDNLQVVIEGFKHYMRSNIEGDTKILHVSLSEREDSATYISTMLETVKSIKWPDDITFDIRTVPRVYCRDLDNGGEENVDYNCYLITFTFSY